MYIYIYRYEYVFPLKGLYSQFKYCFNTFSIIFKGLYRVYSKNFFPASDRRRWAPVASLTYPSISDYFPSISPSSFMRVLSELANDANYNQYSDRFEFMLAPAISTVNKKRRIAKKKEEQTNPRSAGPHDCPLPALTPVKLMILISTPRSATASTAFQNAFKGFKYAFEQKWF